MARKRNTSEDTLIPLTFPLKGINETTSFGMQRPGTSIDALNVRSFDPVTDRARGGRRPGISKYLAKIIAADAETGFGTPIQDINTLSTTDVPPGGGTDSLVSPFVYGRASGAGFGLAKGTDGTSIIVAPPAPEANFIFQCSTWDDLGNCYTGFYNTVSGVVRIYKADAAGVIQWPTTKLPSIGNFIVIGTPGSFRCVVGMTCITAVRAGITERFLYVGLRNSATTSAWIYKFRSSNGTIIPTPGYLNTSYLSSGTATAFGNIGFSSLAHNCLGSIGTILGFDSYGDNGFRLVETNNYPDNAYGTKNLGLLSYGGTRTHTHSKVVSDGTTYFYVIASNNNAQKVRKIGTNREFHPTWSSATVTTGGTITGLAIDMSIPALVITATTGPSFRNVSLADGSQITTGTISPPVAPDTPITQWDEVDTNNAGTFVLWRNSQATNNVMALNSTYATFWGPLNLANAGHYGASVSKAAAPSPPAPATPSARQIRPLVVADGRVFEFNFLTGTREVPLGPTTVTFSKSRRQIFSAASNLNLFYVDGAIYQYYKSSTSAMTAWTLTAGTMPFDSMARAARLICVWRGRIVLSGLIGDPKNWFMSVPHNPFNFDYAATFSEKTAYAGSIAGVATDAGNVDDIVNALVPYSDDLLIFGGDHSITQLTGDPAAGGRLDTISDRIGMAFGRPFCKDPVGQLYFFSSQSGVYLMSPGAYPIQLSQQIKKRLEQVDIAKSHINLAWDLKNQGLAVFITPDSKGSTSHYFWEERIASWHPDFYEETGLDPFCVFSFDGDQPNDAAVMLGCRDGYLRILDNAAADDDGSEIDSYVYIGPLMTENLDEILLYSLQAVLSENSGEVKYDIYVGTSAEKAFASKPVVSGTWIAGRNYVTPVGWAGHAIYIRLSSSSVWAMEVIQASIRTKGKIKRRGGGNT